MHFWPKKREPEPTYVLSMFCRECDKEVVVPHLMVSFVCNECLEAIAYVDGLPASTQDFILEMLK